MDSVYELVNTTLAKRNLYIPIRRIIRYVIFDLQPINRYNLVTSDNSEPVTLLYVNGNMW